MATLNQDEVNALMDAIKDGRVEQTPEANGRNNVIPHDLTSRDRIIRGQMPTLDAINDQIASLLGSGLAGRTRLNLKVNSGPATLMKFVDFNALIPAPTIMAVLALGVGNGMALLAIDPKLGEMLLAAALGDRKIRPDEPTPESRRELTSVERLVLKRLLTIFTDGMARMWLPIMPFKPEVTRFESDPRLASIAPGNEAAIVSTFEFTGALVGQVQLAIPFEVVEPVKKILLSPPRSNSADNVFTTALCNELEHIQVEICAALGKTTMSVSQLIELEAGNIFLLDTEENSPVPVMVEGQPKLKGTPRVSGGSHAIHITHGLAAPPGLTQAA